jgi:hypothetical protein
LQFTPPLYKYQSIKHFTDTANPICKPATGLPYLQLGLVLDFLEWFPVGSKAYLDIFRTATDDGICDSLVLRDPVSVFISSSCWI